MERLGRNEGRYCGDTIDIEPILKDVETASRLQGWTSEAFFRSAGLNLVALHRGPGAAGGSQRVARVYLSTGIHGDEPAGPLAMRQLFQENKWPENLELWVCPCLNPIGFALNCRENARGIDLNREYLKPAAEEIVAHMAWLERQPQFDLCLLLHEDWESHGFYLYEQNPDQRPSLAEPIIERVAEVCPIDPSESIEGRPAQKGIIRPNLDPRSRPDWPEAFFLITHKTRFSYTLEAPSDFPLAVRVAALVRAVESALQLAAGRRTFGGADV